MRDPPALLTRGKNACSACTCINVCAMPITPVAFMGGKRRIIVVVSILKSLEGLACHTYYGLFTNAYCLRDEVLLQPRLKCVYQLHTTLYTCRQGPCSLAQPRRSMAPFVRVYQESIQLSGAYATRQTSWRASGKKANGPIQIGRAKGITQGQHRDSPAGHREMASPPSRARIRSVGTAWPRRRQAVERGHMASV